MSSTHDTYFFIKGTYDKGMSEEFYYLGFSLFSGIGPVKFHKLLHVFGSAEKAWYASHQETEQIIGGKVSDMFSAFKKTIDLEKAYGKLVQKGIALVTSEDKNYPVHLHKVPHAPFVLYAKGDTKVLSQKRTIGIVGTRKITLYGREITQMLTQALVEQGFIVVSGLAFGVDALSHVTTVKNQGKTIAVLGCGVDCCTPLSNQHIYDEILDKEGVIISPVPPGIQATKGSFPMRNSIIAGISQGIVVTEGALDSGSLITASYAKKFGRPVFSVPGPITSSLSAGTNSLIKNGAIAITSISDILDNLGILGQGKNKRGKNKKVSGESPEEQEIVDVLQKGPLHFDEIVRTIKRDSTSIGSLLSLMELKGIIQSVPDGKYSVV